MTDPKYSEIINTQYKIQLTMQVLAPLLQSISVTELDSYLEHRKDYDFDNQSQAIYSFAENLKSMANNIQGDGDV
jgi:hypothetical protein